MIRYSTEQMKGLIPVTEAAERLGVPVRSLRYRLDVQDAPKVVYQMIGRQRLAFLRVADVEELTDLTADLDPLNALRYFDYQRRLGRC